MKPVLVVAHHLENLDWVRRVQGYDVCVVSKSDPSAHIFQPINRGFEASAYLQYIVSRYDELSEYTVFVHGHETSWHHAGRMDALVNSLLPLTGRYRNINKFHTDDPAHAGHSLGYIHFPLHRNRLLTDHGLRPYEGQTLIRPCAMFLVHRDLIRRHPKGMYQALLDTATADECTHDTAISFEYCWFKIFTGQDDERTWDIDENFDAVAKLYSGASRV